MWIMMLWTTVIGEGTRMKQILADVFIIRVKSSTIQLQAPCAAFLLCAYISKPLAQ